MHPLHPLRPLRPPHPMRPTRRRLLALGAAAAATVLPGGAAWAQGYPQRPVRLLVGAGAGGPSDFLARLYGETAAQRLGQPFVIENRAGASGTIAAGMATKAPADGHTLLASGPAATVVAPHLFAKLDYEPERDLTPVSMLGAGGFVLAVHPSVPARNLAELLAHARANPEALTYGTGGIGSSGQLTTELFAERAGLKLRHVPYKGDGQAANDLLAGQIHLMFTAPNVAMAQAKAGKLRILAVTSLERMAALPDTPALAEALPGFEALGWIVLFAPAATPAPALAALADAWAQGRSQPAVRDRLEGFGMYPPPRYGQRDALLALLKAEKQRTTELVRKLGITPT